MVGAWSRFFTVGSPLRLFLLWWWQLLCGGRACTLLNHGVRLLVGTLQGRLVLRLIGLRRAAHVLWRSARFQRGQRGHAIFYVDFFFRLDDDLAADLGGLYLSHLIADETHKHHILWRSTVNPFLVLFPFVVFLAYFLRRAIFGHHHHVMVHAHQHFMPLHGFPDLWRKRIHKHLCCRLDRKIQHRHQQLLQPRSGHLRHMLFKLQGKRCARGRRLVWCYPASATTHAGNLYVLIPLGLFLGTAVDFQIDGLLMENDVGDLYAVADSGGGAVGLRHTVKLRVARFHRAINPNHNALIADGEILTHMNELGIHHANELHLGAIIQALPAVKVRRLQMRRQLRHRLGLGVRELGSVNRIQGPAARVNDNRWRRLTRGRRSRAALRRSQTAGSLYHEKTECGTG